MRLRATAVILLTLGILGVPLPADAQGPANVARIGYLSGASPSSGDYYAKAFQQGLRELGYVEGQNIIIEYRWALGRYEQFPALATELVRSKVDVILALGIPHALAARRATETIPIVFATSGDPVEAGLVPSLARPGGNLTGLGGSESEVIQKRLELLTEAVRGVTRIAVLWNPASPVGLLALKKVEVAAQALRVQLQPVGVRDPTELDSAFSAMTRGRAGALMVIQDPMLLVHRTRLLALVAKSRLPASYGYTADVEAGGLMSYAEDYAALLRRAATYVDKILRGVKPADLPVEQPTKFELVINLKTAKALGLTIPRQILLRADKVIE